MRAQWELDKEAWMLIIHELMQDEKIFFSTQKLDWLLGAMGYFEWLKDNKKEEEYAARHN